VSEHSELGNEFAIPSLAQWQALVAKVMARSAPEGAQPRDAIAALSSLTADGLQIAPLYTADDASVPTGVPGAAPFTRGRTAAGNTTGWDIRAHCADPDPKALAGQIADDLDGGVTSLWLTIGPGATEVADLGVVLEDVPLERVGVSLDAGPLGTAAARAFLEHAAGRGTDPASLTGCLGLDPFGTLARTGDGEALADTLAGVAALAPRVAADHPGLRSVVIDGLVYHDAGAGDTQELGLALAAGVAALRVLIEAGVDVGAALNALEFRPAASADQFATIAKLRAARRTWARVAQVCGGSGPPAGLRQHAVTSWPMTTRHDPWNNILRATLAAFAACVGGAEAITVRPFDAALGRPDALARRIARNTPALLIAESHVAAVLDPAGGSWYVESLTETMAHAAWDVFTGVEKAGGIVTALGNGWVADRIAVAREAQLAALARGEATIVGVTAFPLADERLLERPPAPGPPGGGLPRIRWESELENHVRRT